MGKVTSKLQVTVPKSIADRYGIQPGDQLDWVPAGDVIHVVPERKAARKPTVAEKLRRFDQETERQRARRAGLTGAPSTERGWTREELYGDRPRSR